MGSISCLPAALARVKQHGPRALPRPAPPLPPPRSYKYKAWTDSRLGRQKVERDGVETVLTLVPVNKMYEVFPAYDRLTCWVGEIHGGTGPTLAGADAGATPSAAGQPAAAGEEGRWSGEALAAGRPLAQQRRRLLGSEADEDEGQPAGGPFLFDWEKKPAKLLGFVSGPHCRLAAQRCQLARRPPPAC